MNKALIYNPYWDTLGGGERYSAVVAQALTKFGFQVDICWPDHNIIKHIFHRYNLKLNSVRIIHPHLCLGSIWRRRHFMRPYHLVFWVSDGSLPFLFGKKNLIHFQVPFKNPGPHWLNLIKSKTYSAVICNSKFTQTVISHHYHLPTQVLYPPTSQFESLSKKPYILSVGRFDNLMQNKRQDVMITAFNRMNLKGWKLILAGGLQYSSTLNRLRSQIKSKSIELVINPPYQQLAKLYGSAKLYWHAAGYGVDEQQYPERVEHFGISPLEAMSAGAVPLVYAAGGLKEVVNPGYDGYLWRSIDELIAHTRQLIKSKSQLITYSHHARQTSSKYSDQEFIHGIQKFIH